MRNVFRSKAFWVVIFLIFIIRATAPLVILRQVNAFLGSFSPLYAGHVYDVGLGVWRGSYQLLGLELRLKDQTAKENQNPFFTARRIDISIAWRDLLKGKLTADIEINDARAIVSDNLIEVLQKASSQVKADSQKAKDKLIPLRLERIDIRDSNLHFADVASLPEAMRFRLSHIQGRVSNVTSSESMPLSLMVLQASAFDSTPLKVVATVNSMRDPVAWDLDAELHDFALPRANSWLKRKLPLTFTSGTLDLYSEVRSENGRIEGYMKPFIHKADIVAGNEAFLGLKHFGIEVSTAAANLILRNAKDKTAATKILFAYQNGKFEINQAEALSKAIQNGFSEKIPEGLDNEVSLSEQYQKAPSTHDKP